MKVHTLDLLYQQRERAIASYLIEGPDGWILIETGPMSTVPVLQERLRDHGLDAGDIKHVLVTHIHLDHAGAAGWWAQQGATVYVHRVGAPHIVDPSRLWQSASRIYGDDMEKLWGAVLPAPEERVIALDDGDTLELAGVTITAWDTPGHAWHHHVYQIGTIGFSGDAAGVRLTSDSWLSLPAPPPEFDLEAWRETIARLRAMRFEALYLTHFGRVEDTEDHLQQLAQLLEQATQFIRRQMEEGVERDHLLRNYTEWNRRRARPDDFDGRYEAANPLFMSVDGIMRYWRKRAQKSEQ